MMTTMKERLAVIETDVKYIKKMIYVTLAIILAEFGYPILI